MYTQKHDVYVAMNMKTFLVLHSTSQKICMFFCNCVKGNVFYSVTVTYTTQYKCYLYVMLVECWQL